MQPRESYCGLLRLHRLIKTSALQGKQQELERQQHSDSLKKHLEHRPEREDLVERES